MISSTVEREAYNEWSKSEGWTQPTQKIKFVLQEGQIDPWFDKYFIGIRQINIRGQPLI